MDEVQRKQYEQPTDRCGLHKLGQFFHAVIPIQEICALIADFELSPGPFVAVRSSPDCV